MKTALSINNAVPDGVPIDPILVLLAQQCHLKSSGSYYIMLPRLRAASALQGKELNMFRQLHASMNSVPRSPLTVVSFDIVGSKLKENEKGKRKWKDRSAASKTYQRVLSYCGFVPFIRKPAILLDTSCP